MLILAALYTYARYNNHNLSDLTPSCLQPVFDTKQEGEKAAEGEATEASCTPTVAAAAIRAAALTICNSKDVGFICNACNVAFQIPFNRPVIKPIPYYIPLWDAVVIHQRALILIIILQENHHRRHRYTRPFHYKDRPRIFSLIFQRQVWNRQLIILVIRR
jgi:hypothetical protein